MDELAETLGIDPVELRLRNEPPRHPELDVPFSSRSLADCMRIGAERFHEELPGFDAIMAHFETLPRFDRRWRNKVIDPAFATIRTVIYTRNASA